MRLARAEVTISYRDVETVSPTGYSVRIPQFVTDVLRAVILRFQFVQLSTKPVDVLLDFVDSITELLVLRRARTHLGPWHAGQGHRTSERRPEKHWAKR